MKKGYTLLEILLSITIFLILVSSVFGILSLAQQLKRATLIKKETISSLSFATSYMKSILINARKDDITILGEKVNCLPEDKVTFSTSTSLQIQLPNKNPNFYPLLFRDFQNNCHGFYVDEDGNLLDFFYKGNNSLKITNLLPSYLRVTSFNVSFSGEKQPPLDETTGFPYCPSVSSQGDCLQPAVTFNLEVEHKKFPKIKIRVQMTASQKSSLDFYHE